MRIEVVQCGMCEHYDSEQYCEVWEQYIANDAFYCACGARADRKTENSSEKPNNSKVSEKPTGSTRSKMEQVDKDINVRSKDKPQTYVINPQEPTNDDKCFECDDFFTCGGQCNKIEDEQTESDRIDNEIEYAWKTYCDTDE